MKHFILSVTVLPMALLIGCSSPKTQLSVQPPPTQQSASMTDTAISSNVKTALANDVDLAATKIAVETVGGKVILRGEIKSMVLRKKVEAIVNGVEGVKGIDNRLVITG